MSLSVARPILIEPGGALGALPGRRIFSMLVARLPSLVRGAAVGPSWVTDSRSGVEMDCCDTGIGGRTGCDVLGGGAVDGPLVYGCGAERWRCWGADGYTGCCGPDVYAGDCGCETFGGREVGGCACGGWEGGGVGHEGPDRAGTRTDVVGGGVPAEP